MHVTVVLLLATYSKNLAENILKTKKKYANICHVSLAKNEVNTNMIIKIAAANSSDKNKEAADAICSGKYDEKVINEQIAKLTRGGTIQLFDGDYYIDSFENENNSAIFFGYNDGNARVINIIGDTENKSYNTHFGVCFHVTQNAIDSCDENGSYRVFYGTGQRPEAPGVFYTMTYVNNVNFENFYLYLFNASKPVIGIDCSHFGSSEIHQVGIFTERYFFDRFLHEKPATPCKGCIGIRTCNGSNDEMARCGIDTTDIGGLYTGYDFIGADHMILRDCTAARCCYGYVFARSKKTITLINCADEGNTHLPYFKSSGQLTAVDFNIERYNADYISDDPEGNTEPFALEEVPGGWHGFISYTMEGQAFGLTHFWKNGHGKNFTTRNLYHDHNSRPEHPEYLENYFDVKTNKLITWTGEKWVDAMGNDFE